MDPVRGAQGLERYRTRATEVAAFLAKGDDSPPVDGALSTREVADALGREPGWGAARMHAEARA